MYLISTCLKSALGVRLIKKMSVGLMDIALLELVLFATELMFRDVCGGGFFFPFNKQWKMTKILIDVQICVFVREEIKVSA